MKKLYLIIAMLLVCVMPALAHPHMSKELKEFKLKFLAQEMELTPEQQTKFFDLYTKMMDEKHKAYADARQLEKKVKNNKNATDADYRALSEAMNRARTRDAEIEGRYAKKFDEFLTPKQIYKWKEAEKKFRDRMSEMRQNHRKGRPAGKAPRK